MNADPSTARPTIAAKPVAVLHTLHAGPLEVSEEELRYRLTWNRRLFLAYNKGNTQYGDFYRSKPDFSPVLTPSGRAVTQDRAYRFNHHHSIWLGHARINGVNVFHDNNPTRDNLGDIVIERAESRLVPVALSLADAVPAVAMSWRLETTNAWVAKNNRRLCTERRDITVTPAAFNGRAHVLDVVSRLDASAGDVELSQDTHAYLGVRVSDTIDEEDGGRLRNSHGHQGEAECMGQPANWCDYTGDVAGQPAGITLMVHLANPPTAFFARAYGTMLANPTLHTSLHIPSGSALEQRFRLLIHDGEWAPALLDAAYEAYVADPTS